jgi:hypothetical protein
MAKRYTQLDPRQKLLYSAQARAKKANIPCTISLEDIVIPERCPLLEIKLEKGAGRGKFALSSPTLDRINNSFGYVSGNVAVISYQANLMKNRATPEQLIAFTKNMEKYLSQATDSASSARPYRNQGAGKRESLH